MRQSLAAGLVVLCVAGACGRIGYTPLPSGGGGVGPSGMGGTGAGNVGGTGASGSGGATGSGGGASGSGGGAGSIGGGASGSGGGGASGNAGVSGRGGTGGSAAATGSGGTGGSGGPAGTGGVGGAGGSGGAGSGGAAGTSGTGGQGGASCPAGTLGGHDYAFCVGPLSWPDAASDCAAKGMRLVRIDDAAEGDWVRMMAFAGITSTSSNYWSWIGGTDEAVAGEWRWTDGALFWLGGSNGSAQGGLYTNWVAGSPTNTGMDTSCAILQHATFWTDFDCARLERYVCERY